MKYIIELEDDIKYLIINGRADNRCYTLVRPVEELEVLNSDYINEHYGSLQDEAYKRGYEDGKNSIDMGCEGCKYSLRFAKDEPCKSCSNCYKSKYEPMPKEDDRIEVGDEVEDSDGDKTIVTNIHGNLFDGLCHDGSVMSDLFLDDNHKTGKHYDIQSILEAMRS